jgi:hypothetical protein
LSGKFLSSVVALVCGIGFTFAEKSQSRRLRRAVEDLVRDFESRIPYLSSSRILLDIQRFASKQTVSISNINSEVVDRFVGAFRDEVTPTLAQDVSAGMAAKLQDEFRPTMQQMNSTLEELHGAIVALESQKQESITGELRGLIESLQNSLAGSLAKMGEDFHQALAGAATKEFDNVQSTLEGTRQTLAQMNDQFSSMQSAFAAVIAKAEESTTNQLTTGREQTEALASLMNGLMLKLQETADHNVSAIRHQLTLVVSDLSEKVGALSTDLMTAAQQTASQSRQTADEIIRHSETWSKATAERLEKLVSAIEVRSEEFRTAGQTLLKAHEFITDTIIENAQALDKMAEASKSVASYTTALAGHAKVLEGVHTQQGQVAQFLKDVSANLSVSFDRHETLLGRYQQVFDSYKRTFDQLDTRIGATFKHISDGMDQYTNAVEANFQAIVNTVNHILPKIADHLSSQTGELEKHLEELNTILGRGLERLSAGAR